VIVTVVRFDLAEPIGPDEAQSAFVDNASRYLQVPGLLWKAYLRSEDGTAVGGSYWWRDRASAEAAFDTAWWDGVTAKYGTRPTLDWYEAPVVVDGRTGSIRLEAPAAGDSH